MKKAILLVAWGAHTQRGNAALAVFDTRCRTLFPDLPVRWAFTSPISRSRLVTQKRKSDSTRKALMRLYYEKFEAVAVQPLQTINGREFDEVRATAEAFGRETGVVTSVGDPLMCQARDVAVAAKAILRDLPPERVRNEDVVLMGHGARHGAVSLYGDLAASLAAIDCHVHLGAMNGAAMLSDILPRLNSPRVWLLPLLASIGAHALRDMAGDAPHSWRARIESAGHECVPILRGMAEYANTAAIWLSHLRLALERLH